jgi:hypothetical protein
MSNSGRTPPIRTANVDEKLTACQKDALCTISVNVMLISALVLWTEYPGAQVGFKLPKVRIAKPALKVKSADILDVATIARYLAKLGRR